MIISDLIYLEEVTRVHSFLAGGKRRGRRYSPALISQSNTAIVYQGARSNARALAYYGDAIAVSSSKNDSVILQGNA
ncbi:MAG: hypothetical protein F6J95_025395 [Leptolyngbya sp. SIO1E4]|nr:hypothetical protein [Leptolyngbya sp. SIO1E4]